MELYHLLNRGVEKRPIVIDDSDRLRFLHDMFVFNDARPVDDNHTRRQYFLSASDRKILVDIHAYCLMGNHYHLLVSERTDHGISSFMRKLNMGYAKYFNDKYQRSGYLWQGKYRRKIITRDAHFLYVPLYIHLNPLDFFAKEWRHGRVKNVDRAFEYLREYKWSSFRDYQGFRNFPSVIETSLLKESLGSSQRQLKIMREIIAAPEIAQNADELEI